MVKANKPTKPFAANTKEGGYKRGRGELQAISQVCAVIDPTSAEYDRALQEMFNVVL
jgi:hypothetical protein